MTRSFPLLVLLTLPVGALASDAVVSRLLSELAHQ